MEEKRICQCCKKNHAARIYEADKKDPSKREFYCLECYSRLFLEENGGEGGSLSVCPYCGMTVEEARLGKLVGCAHCYQTMQAGVFPMIENMQGLRAHRGKTPPLEGEFGGFQSDNALGEEYRAKAIAQARFERQCRELEIIIEKLKSEEDFDGAKNYAEKLAAMKSRSAIEEDFVWRTRQALSTQR